MESSTEKSAKKIRGQDENMRLENDKKHCVRFYFTSLYQGNLHRIGLKEIRL